VSVVFVRENIDTATPVGEFFRNVMSSIAEFEGHLMLERMLKGLRAKAARGGYTGTWLPYGYEAVDGEVVVVEAQAAVVRRVFEWRAEGRSLRRMANELNATGVPTQHGRKWHPSVVWEMYRNRFYTGKSKAGGGWVDGQTYKLDDLWGFHERLKGVRIVRQDWKETLRQCDGKDALFFIDPPYIKEWGAGSKARGEEVPPEDIAEGVRGLRGRYVIAYTDSARARRALSKVGRIFKMRFLEARHQGLWSRRSRLFVASFDMRKNLSAGKGLLGEGAVDDRSDAPPA
jgi:hypothetical protein